MRPSPVVGSACLYVGGTAALVAAMNHPDFRWAPGLTLSFEGLVPHLAVPRFLHRSRPFPDRITWPDLLFLAAAAVLVVAHALFLRLAAQRGPTATRRPFLVAVALASGILVLSPSLLSADVFSYIMHGRIALLHGGNPLVDPPAAYPMDPYLAWADWRSIPCVYGPLWVYLCVGITAVAEHLGGSLVAYVLTYKLVATAFHFANGHLIWQIAARTSPATRMTSVLVYLAGPLALVELVGAGHNDVVMIFFLLVGALFHLRARPLAATIALTLAALIKWTAAPAVVLHTVALVRSAGPPRLAARRFAVAAGLGGLVAAAAYARFWAGADTWRALQLAAPETRMANSLGGLLVRTLGPETRIAVRGLARAILVMAGFVAAYAAATPAAALYAMVWLLLVYCTLGALWLWPWYFTSVLALAALLRGEPRRIAVVASSLALAIYPLYGLPWRSLVVLLPPLAMVGIHAHRRLRWAGATGASAADPTDK